MKRLAMLCVLALSVSLLAGCHVTPPNDEEFQRDWADSVADSIEDAAEDWTQDWEDGVEKDHYWKILDISDKEGPVVEAGTVTDEEQVKVLDGLLSDDENWKRVEETPDDGAYSYIYCQQETLKAGQKEEDREYEELVRFTVSASEDVVTLVILEELPSLMNVDLGDLLTFTMRVPSETAEALRDPGQFLK